MLTNVNRSFCVNLFPFKIHARNETRPGEGGGRLEKKQMCNLWYKIISEYLLIIVLQLNTFVGGPPVAHDDYTVTTGYVLMIDNLRTQRRLPFLFMEGFGFRMRKHDFLDKKEMLQELTHTAQRDFSGDDCFWCVIRSDGTKDGICGTDDEVVKPETITSLFSSNKCRTLEGKPKIFVIEKKQTGKELNSGLSQRPVISEDHFLIWYCIIPDSYVGFGYPSPASRLLELLTWKELDDAINCIEREYSEQSWLVSTLKKKALRFIK